MQLTTAPVYLPVWLTVVVMLTTILIMRGRVKLRTLQIGAENLLRGGTASSADAASV
jgi:hypothetical protein